MIKRQPLSPLKKPLYLLIFIRFIAYGKDMRKILLTFLSIGISLSSSLEATTPPKTKKKDTEKTNYWDFDDKSTEELNVSMIAWGVALFVGIALAAGLSNGPAPTKTPDLQ
ncbi:MAG: hypothetical protein FJZ62_01745 [Chlamydiae bacterium]|nr:hypothetical protein [Chlamydiota bacterium]